MAKLELEPSSYDKAQEEVVEHMHKKAKRRYSLLFMFVLVGVTLVMPLCLHFSENYYPIAGGVVGFLCSAVVIVEYLRNQHYRGPPLALLFWRSVADFGLAVRFVATPGFNLLICDKEFCNFTLWLNKERNCLFASAMFEFFEISSEMWFLCVAIDLFLTMTRPFSKFEDRLKYYHIFSWGAGLAFAIPTGLIDTIGGFWYVADRKDGSVISSETFCWLQIEPSKYNTQVLSWKPWVMFYVPLVLSYFFSMSVLYSAFRRLKTGVTFTFIHRLKVLFINSINMSTHILYWTVLLSLYITVFLVADTGDKSKTLFNILLFVIPAKGASAILVWVLVTSIEFGKDADSIDLNTVLREEVLLYASEGIRKTCRRASVLTRDKPDAFAQKTELNMVLKQAAVDDMNAVQTAQFGEQKQIITAWNFFMLVLGFQKQLHQLEHALTQRVQQRADVMTTIRQSMSQRNSVAGSVAASVLNAHEDVMKMDAIQEKNSVYETDGDNSWSDDGRTSSQDGGGSRLSQRNTLDKNAASSMLSAKGSSSGGVGNPLMQSQGSSHANAGGEVGMDEEAEEDLEEDKSAYTAKPSGVMGGPPTSSPGGHKGGLRAGSTGMGSKLSESSSGGLRGSTGVGRVLSGGGVRKVSSQRGLPIHTLGDDDDDDDHFDEADTEVGSDAWYNRWWRALCDWVATLVCCRTELYDDVEFTEYCPNQFRRVRLSANLDDELYRHLFLERVKERLTQGGASGAFFFFSKDEYLIAKSCTEEDVSVLIENAPKYADYMTMNKESYISKVYGCYMLKIYGSQLFFMVMNNIFLNDRQHHNLVKYDIKGSWVKRNAELPRDGHTVTCKFCEQKYPYATKKTKQRGRFARRVTNSGGSTPSLFSRNNSATDIETGMPVVEKAGCSATVDRVHEASVIYKDNDLREKILLPPKAAAKLLRQLQADAKYLHSVGVMDYSLLMGVHYTKYAVDADMAPVADDEDSKYTTRSSLGPASSSSHSSQQGSSAGVFTAAGARSSRPDSDNVGSSRDEDVSYPSRPSLYSEEQKSSLKQMQFCVPLEVGRVVGPDCYYMGIIDFQQKWTWGKKMERMAKVILEGRDPDGLSAIDTDTYFHRFCEKMEDLLDLNADDDDSLNGGGGGSIGGGDSTSSSAAGGGEASASSSSQGSAKSGKRRASLKPMSPNTRASSASSSSGGSGSNAFSLPPSLEESTHKSRTDTKPASIREEL